MKTIGELIERNEAYYPNNIAYAMNGRHLTYRQYAMRIRKLAGALEKLGLRRQDRLGILSTNCIEYYEAYGVCEWAGFILALYNFRIAAPELEHLFKDSAPKAVIFEAQYRDMVDGLRGRFPGISYYICLNGPAPDWAIAYETLIESGPEQGASFRADENDYVYLYYTSGTTGRPKGVPYRQAAALSTARRQGRDLGPDTSVLQISPAFHTGGKGFPLGAMWLAGTVVLKSAFDPLEFLKTVQSERITFTFMVAAMIEAVIGHPQFDEFDLSSLRHIMSAAAPIPVPLLRRALEKIGPVIFLSYGSTEAGSICILDRHELRPNGSEQDLKRLASVGHFVPETDAVILDDDCRPVAQGEVGEVCIKPTAFECYWNNSVATAEAMRGGWLHTGDLGCQDEEGYVYLVDRKKDMIISGGENIYSREVEEALFRNPAVLDAAVIGVPDERWGEAVKAVVALRAGAQIAANELIAFCQTQIARYKCPKTIDIVDELPRLGTGKTDKVTLRKRYKA